MTSSKLKQDANHSQNNGAEDSTFLRDAMGIGSPYCHLCCCSQGSVIPQSRPFPGNNVHCYAAPGAQEFL